MSIETNLHILRATPLIARLDADALRLIAFAGEDRMYRAGEEALRAGEPMSGALVALSGSFALRPSDGGVTRVMGPGDILGEAALVVETHAPASVIAREAAQALTIPRHLFRRVLAEYPANAHAMRTAFAAQLKQMGADLARVETRLRELDVIAGRRREPAPGGGRPA